jgi:3-deoxy-D-manno-octulosonic-acid transferase
MDRLYALAEFFLEPLVPLWLRWRQWKGKEDPARRRERLGRASRPRPKGTLAWIHAASVGESVSVLPLITELRARFPHIHLLLTTGTKTSAALMAARLPKEVIHQYAPVDTKEASWRFMRHWHPDVALFIESELWPNLVKAADTWQCFLGLINGRMSEKSFRFWNKYPGLITKMLGCFNIVLAQSQGDTERLKKLGAKNVFCLGNLKYDAAPLPCDETLLFSLKKTLGNRPVWLAASTHPGEDEVIADTHARLLRLYPKLLTLIVPRHPERGGTIAATLQKRFSIGIRSRGDGFAPNTEIYIADTLGELGLFYRLSEIVFMGGSLVKHGGQNPLEPARLGCSIVTGPHTHNFSDIYRDLETAKACMRAADARTLSLAIDTLFKDTTGAQILASRAREWVEGQTGATKRVADKLAPILAAV